MYIFIVWLENKIRHVRSTPEVIPSFRKFHIFNQCKIYMYYVEFLKLNTKLKLFLKSENAAQRYTSLNIDFFSEILNPQSLKRK